MKPTLTKMQKDWEIYLGNLIGNPLFKTVEVLDKMYLIDEERDFLGFIMG